MINWTFVARGVTASAAARCQACGEVFSAMNRRWRKRLRIAFIAVVVAIVAPAYAQENATAPAPTPRVAEAPVTLPPSAAENLASIQQSIENKRQIIAELRKQAKRLDDATEKQDVEKKIQAIKHEIDNLQSSFNHIALNGLSLQMITGQPDLKVNWKEELEQISRPLLSSLKELTEKPRLVDSLRRDIERKENQLKLIDRALDSLHKFDTEALPPSTTKTVKELLDEWTQHKLETRRALDINHYKLSSLETESTSWFESVGEAISGFGQGRGLNMLIAVVSSIIVWLLFKAMLALYLRWLYHTRLKDAISRAPLILYSYRLVTAIFVVFTILTVFYVRGDILLLTLLVIVLVSVALSLRQTLPRYAAELRLLLAVGPVRENERLVIDGVPLRVESLSIFAILRNPELEGVVRLPLHVMSSHTSRPAGDEPWFPCQKDDYVILENGSLGKVIRQTVELVELLVVDSRVQMATGTFLSMMTRNLSREGYGIAGTFGIDYQHQAICLDVVPQRLLEGIQQRFEREGMKNDVRELMVEFTQAGASSLDYRIYIIMEGRAAKAYYKAQRMVQQACVQVCNDEGWVIPFTQVTMHLADDSSLETIAHKGAAH